MIDHDLSMHILYRFHGWLIFVRVIALFMFVWPYVRPHILCTQLVICLLSHFIHIWYLGWPWSEHAHIMPISRMVDFCESYSPFHVCLTICPSAHLVYATSHLSFVAFYSYLVSWLAMIWAWSEPFSCLFDHILSCVRLSHLSFSFIFGILIDHDLSMHILWFHESYSPFHVCLTIRLSAHLVYATSHLSFVAFYSYLVSWLTMIWACAYYADFTDGWFLREL